MCPGASKLLDEILRTRLVFYCCTRFYSRLSFAHFNKGRRAQFKVGGAERDIKLALHICIL